MADLGVQRPAAEAGAGYEPRAFLRNHRRIGALRAILRTIDCGSGGPLQTAGLFCKMVGPENQPLSPGLDFGLELGGTMQVG
jgi:hypothetical protein